MVRRFLAAVALASAILPFTASVANAGPVPCGKIVIKQVYVANIPCIFE